MVGPELVGATVKLRPLLDNDLIDRVGWLNDEETVKLFTGIQITKEYQISDADRWRRNLESDPISLIWAIETKLGRHIGDVDLHAIDRYYKSAKLTILIGDKKYWNHGYGSDTIKTILRYAFTDMKMLNIDLRVFDFNIRGIKCYKKCGFIETTTPSPGQMGASEPNEVYMAVSKERFLSELEDAISLRSM